MSQKFGKYSVVYRLGAGGMAEVFKCRLSGIGGFSKLVVVKRIRPELVRDPSFLHMFLDEARIAANLQHPNVVQLFEIDQAEGLPYIAMEYVRGPTLSLINREERKRGNRSGGAVARIMAGICAGLHYAHRATDERGTALGIVHRDVSPQNIIVSMEGVPKLLDFGVAKARGQLAHTTAGALKGKLKFMAPEQFVPGGSITPAVDVFAAGVCLYEAMTHQLPYGGETEIDVMRNAAAGKFPRPSELVPLIDSRLEELILWAMAPNPANRCPDARALQLALEDYADREACSQAELARYLDGLFPDATGDTQLKTAYVDVDDHDILGPPTSASVVRRTLEMRAARHPPATPPPVEPELEIDVELPARRESRAPMWGAVAAVAVIAVFALAIAVTRQAPAFTVAPAVPDAGVLVQAPPPAPVGPVVPVPRRNVEPLLAAAHEALDKGHYAEAAALARAVLSEHLDEPRATALLLEATSFERARERDRERETPPVILQVPGPVVPTPPPVPQPQRRAVREPAPSRGTLSIETDPLAQVQVNGKPLGWSPIDKVSLSPGTYLVRATHQKRQQVEREVRIVAGRDTRVSIDLPELPREREPEPAPVEEEKPAPPPAPPPPPPVVEAKREPAKPVAAAAPAPAPASPPSFGYELECPEEAHLVRGSTHEIWCEAGGLREGPYLRLWPNGKKAVQGEFRRGKKHGRWLEFYEGGGERSRVEWRRGVQMW